MSVAGATSVHFSPLLTVSAGTGQRSFPIAQTCISNSKLTFQRITENGLAVPL